MFAQELTVFLKQELIFGEPSRAGFSLPEATKQLILVTWVPLGLDSAVLCSPRLDSAPLGRPSRAQAWILFSGVLQGGFSLPGALQGWIRASLGVQVWILATWGPRGGF